MQRRYDEYLCKIAPNLLGDRHADMRTTAMCWGFDCGDGWYQLLKEACIKLEALIVKERVAHPEGWNYGYFRASQIKEKYGTLRFYLSGGTPEMYKITDEAERKSRETCERCGKPGKLRGDYWVYMACDKHVRKD